MAKSKQQIIEALRKEIDRLKAGQKVEPEPTEFTKDVREQVAVDECNQKSSVSWLRLKLIQSCDEIDRLTAENAKQKELIEYWTVQDKQATKGILALEDELKTKTGAVKEALSISKIQWAEVQNHPASRFARDVEYFEKALKGSE